MAETEPLDTFYNLAAPAPLITLTVAKETLHVTDSDHDSEITRLSHQATDLLLSYLKHGADPAWTETTVPLPVQAAIGVLLAHLWADRGDHPKDSQPDAAERAWKSVELLVGRFRDPAYA